MKIFTDKILILSICSALSGLSLPLHTLAQTETVQKNWESKAGFIKQDLKGQGYVHQMSDEYTWPEDTAVLTKLDRWRDLKFGVLFHWGLYSVKGISESWPLCAEDRFMARRRQIQPDLGYEDFKKWYWGQMKDFNPTKFDPETWADLMQDAGMKYMIFTTKHHDGFCMYDTRETDYSIAQGPFKNHPLKDVARHVFDAFRQKDFMIAAYFSKPDWHCPYYWHPDKATPDRRANYDIGKHSDWWGKYRAYTARQIQELMSGYGRIDILWLDGGWVQKNNGEDLDIDRIVSDARKLQPGLIAVDRTVHGKNENYLTPEMRIPPQQLPYPWESCITLTNRWGWCPKAPYKSAWQVINMLGEIVAKGGSLVLGVGPKPDGTIEAGALQPLKEMGEWLRAYGKAIYGTRVTPHYHSDRVWFTADKDGKTLYAIYALPEGETLPATIEWKGNLPKGSLRLLRGNRKVKYRCQGGKVTVVLPHGLKEEPLAFCFQVKK